MEFDGVTITESYLRGVEELKSVNDTLHNSGRKKIGIFLPSKNGDLMTAMSVLKYKDVLWPDSDIVWFANLPWADALKYSTVSEVRPWVNGDYQALHNGEVINFLEMFDKSTNRIDQNKKLLYPMTADLDDAYFPAPWMVHPNNREGINYPNVSKKIFGVESSLEWHPLLGYSEQEKTDIDNFIKGLPNGKIIIIETFAGSGQSKMNDGLVRSIMEICTQTLGLCVFVFVSDRYVNGNDQFPTDLLSLDNVAFAAKFTPRQCGLLSNYCDFFVSVSSSISVASSRWDNKPFPMLQYTGTKDGGTKDLAIGMVEQIFSDPMVLAGTPHIVEAELLSKLKNMLDIIK